MTVRVGVLDDHRAFGEVLSLALAGFDGIYPVGVAHTVDALVALALEHNPAVVLVDYQLMHETGIDCADRLVAEGLDLRLILLTAHASGDVITRALGAGFEPVLSKESPIADIAQALTNPALQSATPHGRSVHFSPRQREVLNLMGQGLDPASIADELFISVHTERSHVKDVLRTLGASTQLAAVTKAIREGYLLPPTMHERVR